MVIWDKVLVVDDSKVYRKLMETLLAPYCGSVLTATGPAEGIAQIEQHPDIELVLCDYLMREGDGFEVLEMVAALQEPKPSVVMVTGYPAEKMADRARELGAVDYLVKPTHVRSILRALRRSRAGERRQFNARFRCSGQAHLMDGGSGCVIWDLYNISPTGAFLETKGPIPVGSELELRLILHGRKTDLRARVARVQEPSWMDVGGVGVEFIDVDADTNEMILEAIEQSELEER